VEESPKPHSFQYIFYLSSRCLERFWSCSWAPLVRDLKGFFFWLEISKALPSSTLYRSSPWL